MRNCCVARQCATGIPHCGLNDLDVLVGNVSNAYLNANCCQKIWLREVWKPVRTRESLDCHASAVIRPQIVWCRLASGPGAARSEVYIHTS